MYSDPRTQQYIYAAQAAQAAPAPSQFTAHGTSSAFSSSANPDEDWTKISDLAERRRIQNRIAQRNYRKKLKKRLADLERRAGSPPPSGEKPNSTVKSSTKRSAQQAKAPKPASTPSMKQQAQGQFTPPMHHDDEYLFPTVSYHHERERSYTPPGLFGYPSYPPPSEEMPLPPFGVQAYRPQEASLEYLAPPSAPVSLPPMTHFNDAYKRGSTGYAAEDSLPSYIGYGYLPGVDMSAGHPSPYEHMPHTPPLGYSPEHSANCSDPAGYEYPTTPLSMPPDSPDYTQQ